MELCGCLKRRLNFPLDGVIWVLGHGGCCAASHTYQKLAVNHIAQIEMSASPTVKTMDGPAERPLRLSLISV